MVNQSVAVRAPEAHDPELERVRVLLCALRPGAVDPFEPTPEAPSEPTPMRVSNPAAAWGGIPRSVETPPPAMPARGLADVARELAELPEDARAVLRFVQLWGSLAAGLRGFFFDVGWAFRSADHDVAWSASIAARREGAYLLGRHLVWRAAEAWGR